MVMLTSMFWGALLASPFVLLVGVWLLWTGWRGGRSGSAPHCRRCGYDLSGSIEDATPRDACPECGASLRRPRAVQTGATRRRPVRMTAGGVLIVGTLAWVAVVAGPIFAPAVLLANAPTGFLLVAEPHADDRLRGELLDRIHRGAISDHHAQRYIERLLHRRDSLSATESGAEEFGELERQSLIALQGMNHMDDAQIGRWIRGATEPFLRGFRSEPIRFGQRVVVGIEMNGSLLGDYGGVGTFGIVNPPPAPLTPVPQLTTRMESVEVEGREPRRLGGSTTGDPRNDRRLYSRIPLDLEVGEHTVWVNVRASVESIDPDLPEAEWRMRLPVTVRVLPGEDAAVEPIIDDSLRTVVHAGVDAVMGNPSEITIDGMLSRFNGFGGVVAVTAPLPVAFAAQILIRDANGEHRVGQLVASAGETAHWTVSRGDVESLEPIEGRIDIILRPDSELALRMIGTRAIWGEEVTIEGVSFERE